MKVGEFSLEPGEYVFGYQRKTPDSITVTFYRAPSGDAVGEVEAVRKRKSSTVRQLLIQPVAGGRGRFRWVGSFSITGFSEEIFAENHGSKLSFLIRIRVVAKNRLHIPPSC